MKNNIKLFDVIDQIGYENNRIQDRQSLSYAARYFLPEYIKTFGRYFGNNDQINSLEDLAGYLLETSYPQKLKVSIYPEILDSMINFESCYNVCDLSQDSYIIYVFCLKDLKNHKPGKFRDMILWILNYFLTYTPIGYQDYEEILEYWDSMSEDALDEEDQEYTAKLISEVHEDVSKTKTYLNLFHENQFTINAGKEHYHYLLKGSRHHNRHKYAILLKKMIRFATIIKEEPIGLDIYENAYCGFQDLFMISLTDHSFVVDEHMQRTSNCEEWSMLNLDIYYDPKNEIYSFGLGHNYHHLKYAMKLYHEFITLYYE